MSPLPGITLIEELCLSCVGLFVRMLRPTDHYPNSFPQMYNFPSELAECQPREGVGVAAAPAGDREGRYLSYSTEHTPVQKTVNKQNDK